MICSRGTGLGSAASSPRAMKMNAKNKRYWGAEGPLIFSNLRLKPRPILARPQLRRLGVVLDPLCPRIHHDRAAGALADVGQVAEQHAGVSFGDWCVEFRLIVGPGGVDEVLHVWRVGGGASYFFHLLVL